jgi:hypothetical protein
MLESEKILSEPIIIFRPSKGDESVTNCNQLKQRLKEEGNETVTIVTL